jgi:hypothetical protein
MNLPLPKAVERKLAPVFARSERFIRDWEWTWANAVIVCVLLSFFILTTQAIIPSWFLYFANQRLQWTSFWLLILRDAIATGWIGTWFAITLIVAAMLQNIRRKVRGATSGTRPTGGYR